ncbi:MAG: lipid II flippase MurJ [Candidatus Zixiibacteriota bacterium]
MAGKTVRAVAGVATVVFLSKVLGLGREIVIADRFGTSSEYDLYLVAVMIPALAYGVINFATYNLLVPHLTRLFESDGRTEADHWHSAWTLFNKWMLTAAVVTGLIILAAPILLPLWSRGHLSTEFDRILFYTRVTAIIAMLGTSEAFLRAILNTRRIFTYPSGSYIVDNLINITAVIFLAQFFSVGAAVIGLVVGSFAQNVYLGARVARLGGLKFYSFSLREKTLRMLLPTAGLLVVIELLNRSYFLVDRYIAARFGEGIISALNYSQVLVQLPDAIVGFAIATVVFPMFSSIDHEDDPERFGRIYRFAVTGGLLIALPIALFFYFNAQDIVHVIFLRGVFDSTSLDLTTQLLEPYCPTIVALFIISTSVRACYAKGWARSVLFITIAGYGVKIAGTILLPRWFGFSGISLATSASMLTMAAGLLIFCLRKSREGMNPEFRRTVWRLIGMGLVLGMALVYVSQFEQGLESDSSWLEAAERLAVSGVITAGLYSVLMFLFGFGSYLRRLRGIPADVR